MIHDRTLARCATEYRDAWGEDHLDRESVASWVRERWRADYENGLPEKLPSSDRWTEPSYRTAYRDHRDQALANTELQAMARRELKWVRRCLREPGVSWDRIAARIASWAEGYDYRPGKGGADAAVLVGLIGLIRYAGEVDQDALRRATLDYIENAVPTVQPPRSPLVAFVRIAARELPRAPCWATEAQQSPRNIAIMWLMADHASVDWEAHAHDAHVKTGPERVINRSADAVRKALGRIT